MRTVVVRRRRLADSLFRLAAGQRHADVAPPAAWARGLGVEAILGAVHRLEHQQDGTASGTFSYCGINPRFAFARQYRGYRRDYRI